MGKQKRLVKVRFDDEACHRAIWLWLHKNPKKKKRDYPGIKTIERLLDNDQLILVKKSNRFLEKTKLKLQFEVSNHFCDHHCFACAHTMINHQIDLTGSPKCSKCPLDFGEKTCEQGANSLYRKWKVAIDLETKSELALAIANLPWVEKK